jgi:hypothetical protein
MTARKRCSSLTAMSTPWNAPVPPPTSSVATHSLAFLEYLLWLGKALVLLNVLSQWFRLMDRYLPPPRVRD